MESGGHRVRPDAERVGGAALRANDTTVDAGSAGAGGETGMSSMRALRLVLAVVIAVLVLRAAPAYPWHGTGEITALAIEPPDSNRSLCGDV